MNEREFHEVVVVLLTEMRDIMASLDEDVQTAVTVINDLVTALEAATGSGVSSADQTALETAIAAGQAALAPPATPVTTPTPATPPPPPVAG